MDRYYESQEQKMKEIYREFFKVDELEQEIISLNKQLAEYEFLNMDIGAQLDEAQAEIERLKET